MQLETNTTDFQTLMYRYSVWVGGKNPAALKFIGLLLFKFWYSLFLIFQVKDSHDFYADELSAFQFKVTAWAISLHYFQLKYVHRVHVNAY